MKVKLKGWVKVAIFFILFLFLTYIIYSMFMKKTTIISEGKNYTCYGSIVFQVCHGITYE